MKRLVNLITASRIILAILFALVVLIDYNSFYLSIIFILTAISDYSDGKLARRFKISSENGGKFDVVCDFIFIMISTFALVLIDLIPFWFLLVIILKLIEFFKTSTIKGSLYYEKLGHIVALMFYVLPIVSVLINSKSISLILCIFITICAIFSSSFRIIGVNND